MFILLKMIKLSLANVYKKFKIDFIQVFIWQITYLFEYLCLFS